MSNGAGFTHVSRDEGEERLHFSHLYSYVSAYELTDQMLDELSRAMISARSEAREQKKPQLVDLDGEMFFMVYPSGSFSLCLRWKTYKMLDEPQG